MTAISLRLARRVQTNLTPRPNNPWARAGLRYENNIAKTLRNQGHTILHNPQFYYETIRGRKGYCIPDIILFDLKTFNPIVIEVKLSYKEEAITKLRELYLPVVCLALKLPEALPLLITKSLTPLAPPPFPSLEEALSCTDNAIPLVHWLGRGKIPTS